MIESNEWDQATDMLAGPHTVPDCWPRAAASATIFRGESVLLVEHGGRSRSGMWSLPGGHIESGETARAAAAREIGEETGLSVEILGLVDVHDVILRDAQGELTAHYVLTVFYGRWLSGEPAAASDCRDARFVPLAELEDYALTDGAWRLIDLGRALFRGSSGTRVA